MSAMKRLLLATTALFVPTIASAQRTLGISVGTPLGLQDILNNIIVFLAGTIITISLIMFVMGALFMVISRGNEQQVTRGKELMIGAVIGLTVVLGAYGIVRTVFFLIYG